MKDYIRILHLKDTHVHASPPYLSRVGPFFEQITNKLNQVKQIINDQEVDIIIHAGDLAHEPNPRYEVLSYLISYFEEINKPVFINPGNHDLLGHAMDSIKYTLLGILQNLGYITVLDDKTHILNINDVTLQITGSPYNPSQDVDKLYETYYRKKETGVNQSIHVVHSMLMPEKLPIKMRHTSIDEVLSTNTEVDVYLCGHNHVGYNTVEKDNKLFFCINAISRLRIREQNIHPNVAIIDVYKDTIEHRLEFLRDIEPASNKFVKKEYRKKEEIEEIPLFLYSNEDFEGIVDVGHLIKEVHNKRHMPPEILQKTLTLIDRYRGGDRSVD